jgi:glycosyltransferase involved in cell wall biosynthesis
LVTLTQRKLLPQNRHEEARQVLKKYCRHVRVFQIPTDYSKTRWLLLLFFNLFSRKPYSVWRFKSRAMTAEIRKLHAESKFDAVYVDTIALAEYGMTLGDVPKLLNHHNIESTLMFRRSQNEQNLLVRWYLSYQARKLRRYERHWAERYTVNLTVSDLDGADLLQIAPGARYEVIPNGTDISYFTPGSVDESRELVFAGGMRWYPNRDAMLFFAREIFPRIKARCPDVVMNVIGIRPPETLLSIASHEPQLLVHGYVDDVREYMRRAAVYVVPIRVGGGTRLKILDAFAAGKAVVSTSVGCEGIDVTPGNNILVADEPEEFAARVVELLENHEMRRQLEHNARKLVEEKYNWDTIGDKLRLLLREITD